MSVQDVAGEWLRRVGDRDIEGELELWAQGGTLEFPFAAAPAPTRLSAGPALRSFRTAVGLLVPRLEWLDVEYHPLMASDRLWLTARSHGVAVNGRPFTGEYAMLFSFVGDRIASVREYADPAAPARTFSAEELAAARLSDETTPR